MKRILDRSLMYESLLALVLAVMSGSVIVCLIAFVFEAGWYAKQAEELQRQLDQCMEACGDGCP